jgi:hypothetical protein
MLILEHHTIAICIGKEELQKVMFSLEEVAVDGHPYSPEVHLAFSEPKLVRRL